MACWITTLKSLHFSTLSSIHSFIALTRKSFLTYQTSFSSIFLSKFPWCTFFFFGTSERLCFNTYLYVIFGFLYSYFISSFVHNFNLFCLVEFNSHDLRYRFVVSISSYLLAHQPSSQICMLHFVVIMNHRRVWGGVWDDSICISRLVELCTKQCNFNWMS